MNSNDPWASKNLDLTIINWKGTTPQNEGDWRIFLPFFYVPQNRRSYLFLRIPHSREREGKVRLVDLLGSSPPTHGQGRYQCWRWWCRCCCIRLLFIFFPHGSRGQLISLLLSPSRQQCCQHPSVLAQRGAASHLPRRWPSYGISLYLSLSLFLKTPTSLFRNRTGHGILWKITQGTIIPEKQQQRGRSLHSS